MIEKLDPIKHTENLYDKNGFITNVACGGVIIKKVNELIDAINGILTAQEQYATIYNEDIVPMLMPENKEPADNSEKANCQENVQDRMIGCTTLDIPESYKTDPYAEQHQWIGCVCRFWYDNPNDTLLDYLDKIQTGKNGVVQYYSKESGDWFPHCEPVKPDDDIIYKGE